MPDCSTEAREEVDSVHTERVESAALPFYSIFGSIPGTEPLARGISVDLFLVAPDLDLTIELPLPTELADSVRQFLTAVEQGRDHEEFCARLGREIGRIIPEIIDWDHKPPTKAQIAFAQSLCKRFGMTLPASAKASRGAMHRFLEVNAARLPR